MKMVFMLQNIPALKGCHSQGATIEEALENIKDAIRLNIEDRQAVGENIPVEVLIEEVEISV